MYVCINSLTESATVLQIRGSWSVTLIVSTPVFLSTETLMLFLIPSITLLSLADNQYGSKDLLLDVLSLLAKSFFT